MIFKQMKEQESLMEQKPNVLPLRMEDVSYQYEPDARPAVSHVTLEVERGSFVAVMLWIWFVLPMLARRIPIFFRLTADVAAVGVYVFLISIDLSGGAWFRGLALPILGWACVLVFLLSFLLRGGRRSRLSAIAMCIGTVGLMALGVEYCMDRFFRAAWQPTWSLVVVVICVGLIIPLRVVRRVPSLREEARRRFNM